MPKNLPINPELVLEFKNNIFLIFSNGHKYIFEIFDALSIEEQSLINKKVIEFNEIFAGYERENQEVRENFKQKTNLTVDKKIN